jgi:hypothetical protein
MSTIKEIESKIQKHQQELRELEESLIKAKQESPEQQLAKELHGLLCTWNHTDGCGWFYEIKNKEDDWLGHAHGEYLKKAQRLVHYCNRENVSVEKVILSYKIMKALS